jgi:hypothetical protein
MNISANLCRPRCTPIGPQVFSCLVMLLLLLPLSGLSQELTLGIDSAYIYDSNFFRSATDEEAEDSVVLGGNISLEQQEGRLRYLASYSGSYQAHRDQEDADAPDHRVRLNGSYDISPRTTFHVTNYYRDVSNLRFSREDISDGDSGLEPNDESYQRNDLELMLHRDITRSWEMEINAIYRIIDFERNVDRSDSESFEAGGKVFYRFAPRHRFGGGVSWVGQEYDGAGIRLDVDADYLITDLAWIFDVEEDLQLVVNGGPVWINTEEDSPEYVLQSQFVGDSGRGEALRANVRSCDFDSVTATGIASRCDFNTPGAEPIPALDLGEVQSFALGVGSQAGDDDDVVFFGGIALEGRFSDWTVDMELRRQQSSTSGDSVAASLNVFRWEFGYAPARANWDAFVAGSWERRETLSDSTAIDYTVVPGVDDAAQRSQVFTRVRDTDDRRDTFVALVGVRNSFSRAFSGTLGVRFRRTEREVNGVVGDEIDTYFIVAELSYVFDTIRF